MATQYAQRRLERSCYHEAVMPRKPCIESLTLKRFWEEELRATAYHEAGHAVLYAFFDLPFERVEVFSDKHPAPPELKEDYAGIVRSDWIRDCPHWAIPGDSGFRLDRTIKHFERLICISLAGDAAECRYNLNKGWGTGKPSYHDHRDIQFICRHVIGCPVSLQKDWIDRLRLQTWEILNQAAVWNAVTAVAEALLDRAVMTRAEVQAVVEIACPRGSKLPSVRKQGNRHSRRLADKKQREALREALCAARR